MGCSWIWRWTLVIEGVLSIDSEIMLELLGFGLVLEDHQQPAAMTMTRDRARIGVLSALVFITLNTNEDTQAACTP